jgi:hypothetical protein
VNYNVEAVRAGMSPYFAKYGYSRRFHREFVAAQDEARAAERGIWDPAKQHYLDYEQRLTWWNARARFIARFERDGAGRDDMIDLTDWDAMRRLEQMEGEEVVVLATVGEVYRSDRVTRVMLSRRRGEDLPLVFFDARVLERSGIERHSGEYVRVSGVVAKYRSRRKRGAPREQLQIVVNVPRQVTVPDYQRPRGSVAPEATAGPAEPALEAPREP